MRLTMCRSQQEQQKSTLTRTASWPGLFLIAARAELYEAEQSDSDFFRAIRDARHIQMVPPLESIAETQPNSTRLCRDCQRL